MEINISLTISFKFATLKYLHHSTIQCLCSPYPIMFPKSSSKASVNLIHAVVRTLAEPKSVTSLFIRSIRFCQIRSRKGVYVHSRPSINSIASISPPESLLKLYGIKGFTWFFYLILSSLVFITSNPIVQPHDLILKCFKRSTCIIYNSLGTWFSNQSYQSSSLLVTCDGLLLISCCSNI